MKNRLELVYRNPSDLKKYDKNSRKHSAKQIERISKSISEFGFVNPVLVDGNKIVAGHARIMGSIKLDMSEVPTIDISYLSKKQIQAYVIADNKLAELSEWDDEILKSELTDLFNNDYDLSLIGFDDDELDFLISDGESNDADSVPELQEDAVAKLGDIYQLGEHRLMCGDSTNEGSVELLLDGNIPILMVTDPPYGVNYDPKWREDCDKGYGSRATGSVMNDDLIDWSDAYKLFPGDVSYIWHAAKYTHIVSKNIEDCGYEIISHIIWAKQHFVLSRGDYHWQHEPCVYAVKKGKKHNWQGKRDQATVWDIKNNNSFGNSEKEETYGHGTQKPIECMLRPILNNSEKGEMIYDPFGGSGTTLIACEKSSRKCFMMELDPKYIDMIIKRWEDFSGKKSVKVS